MLRLLRILWAYLWTRHQRFDAREALERHQQHALGKHLDWLSRHSRHFSRLLARTSGTALERLEQLPVIDKASWLASFDEANTAELTLAQAREVALRAETERNFSPTVNGCTVGLSSGTSGSRGVFVVSAAEQARWAGVILAKLLPRGLLARERVAFFLRANSNLYTEVRSRHLQFEFYDLLQPFDAHLVALEKYRPTIIVAPAQVLRALALSEAASRWQDCTVVSVAEVLEPATRELLTQRFAAVREVYQATEGLLATSCEHGRLHLNEEHLVVEKEWVDADRFVPVITDLARRTQPLVRYRLNDVLRVSAVPCECGRASHVIEAIEGRCDDQLVLPSKTGGAVTVFADAVSRVFAQVLPFACDYELQQTGATKLTLRTEAGLGVAQAAQQALEALLARYGVAVPQLTWSLHPSARFDWTPHAKRRRIRRIEASPASCASELQSGAIAQ